ncbi:MAG TPA: polymer-forming cytoskeletal protein [Candidatus Angelobacter sp.]|nr:polymer-forming cytoskeletal protein [Candidatus Angelobacter sp.]
MVRTKTKSWIAAASFLALLVAAFLMASVAHAASTPTKKSTKASADTVSRSSDDEGISVRVIDGGKTRADKTTRVTRKATGDEGDEVDTPDKPDTPEPPEPPDHGDNDLVRFGEDITIQKDKVVDGSVIAIGGDIFVEGEVRGDCTSVGGSVTIDSTGIVKGDAVSVGGSTTVHPGGRVRSNVSVGGGAWARTMHGHHFGPWLGLMGVGAAVAGVMSTVVQLLITLLLAWLALLLIRERMVFAVERMSSHFGKSLLWGLIAWMGAVVLIPTIVIVGAIAMVILVITIIGIPIAILLLIAMIFALIGAVLGIIILIFLGYVNGCMYLGRLVLHRRTPGAPVSPMKAVIVGSVLVLGIKILGNVIGFLGLVFLMPIGIALGIAAAVLCAVLTTTGMGAMVLTRLVKGSGTLGAPSMGTAAPGAGWYSPPPTPSAPPPPEPPRSNPEGGSSDAP